MRFTLRAGARREEMEAFRRGEACSKERKPHSDMGGVSSHAVEAITHVYTCTAITDAAKSSTAESKFFGRRSRDSRSTVATFY